MVSSRSFIRKDRPKRASRQNLLIIYYNFPPVKVPGAVRISNFYREAGKYFNSVHALTSANRALLQQDPELETNCQRITEVPAYDLRRLTLSKQHSNQPYLSSPRKHRPLFRWMRRLLDSFPFNILLGDGGAYYIWRGYLAGKRLVEEEGITHVFSTFRPYSDHIIAHLLKRRFPQLTWVADFRDLHVDPVLDNVLFPAFQKRCNRWVLRRADVVSTVSEGLKQSLDELHGRVVVLRNGIGHYKRTTLPPFEHFTIAYTGSLNPNLQSPQPLFRALRQLLDQNPERAKQIRIRYAGKDHLIWKKWIDTAGLSAIAHTYDCLPLAKAREIQQRAHLNVLLSWSQAGSRGILTCKLYEYLAAGRPILGLVNGEDEELLRFIQPLPSSFYHSDATPDGHILAFLRDSTSTWKNGERLPRTPQALIAPYQWRFQMEGFINELLPDVQSVSITDYRSV